MQALATISQYVIANKSLDGTVELNPRVLATLIGCTLEDVQHAIAYLSSPDPESRNPTHEGKRLLKVGQYLYDVVSHEVYSALKNSEELKAYNRKMKAESRAKNKASLHVNTVSRQDVNDKRFDITAKNETEKQPTMPEETAKPGQDSKLLENKSVKPYVKTYRYR